MFPIQLDTKADGSFQTRAVCRPGRPRRPPAKLWTLALVVWTTRYSGDKRMTTTRIEAFTAQLKPTLKTGHRGLRPGSDAGGQAPRRPSEVAVV